MLMSSMSFLRCVSCLMQARAARSARAAHPRHPAEAAMEAADDIAAVSEHEEPSHDEGEPHACGDMMRPLQQSSQEAVPQVCILQLHFNNSRGKCWTALIKSALKYCGNSQ